MSATPTSVRIRAYNVGFGDCFLLSFTYTDLPARHVLIDFGTTKLPAKGPTSLKAVAQKIAEHCGGKLHMVVVTHRHADHLSGFAGASGAIIKGLAPDLVVQPWTEDPDLDPDATAPGAAVGGAGASGGAHGAAARAVVTRLGEMHSVAGQIRSRATKLMAAGSTTPPALAEEIHFLGETNISNPAAVRNLMTMGKRRVYARFGTRLPLAAVLPGVKVRVLGPPTADQAPGIANMASKDATEYWHLAARIARRTAAGPEPAQLFPDAETKTRLPLPTRWLVPQIDRMNAEELLGIVRNIDDALNNTSLILLFEIGGTKLLFSGDAQIEDWRYALFDAPNAAAIRASLADTAVYKVGHHGSLNGTPKTMWFGFQRRGGVTATPRLRTLLSTLGGKHGKPSRGTEVPRAKLVDALEAESDLTSTQRMQALKEFWRDVDIRL